MIQNAKFLEKQPAYKIVSGLESDNKVRVFICLNERQVEVDYDHEREETCSCYEYDYNEFVDCEDNLDLDDIAKNPQNYLDYAPTPAATDSEKIQAQVMYTAMMTDTVLED